MITCLHIFDRKTFFSVTRRLGPDSDLSKEIIAGLIMIEADDYIRMTSVFVSPPHRSQGHGRALLKEALDYKPSKRVYIEIDSFSDQTENDGLTDSQLKEFYRSLGFTPVPAHPFAYVLEPRA